MKTSITVGTHDGPFHADDVLACATLQMVYSSIGIIRSRDPERLAMCDILVDVGAQYDGLTKFDHHQKGRAGERPNGVLYSSFGLIWKKYGEHLAGSAEAADLVDRRFVQHVDMLDNGQRLFEGPSKFPGAQQVSLSSLISLLNPRYDEVQNFDAGFHAALVFAGHFLDRMIQSVKGEIAAREPVRQACLAAGQGDVITLTKFVPWGDTVHQYATANAKFVIFPSESLWMVQTIPVAPGSFTARHPLPEAWAGLRDEALQAATGVPGAVFCHPGRFIMGAKDLPDALQLAAQATAPV